MAGGGARGTAGCDGAERTGPDGGRGRASVAGGTAVADGSRRKARRDRPARIRPVPSRLRGARSSAAVELGRHADGGTDPQPGPAHDRQQWVGGRGAVGGADRRRLHGGPVGALPAPAGRGDASPPPAGNGTGG